jgi:asparagine synthase (glutamine-hydrolysing)
MCGIAGAVNFNLSYPDLMGAMLHRGPDEQAGFKVHNVDFFHFRLSILDISGGKQPMSLNDRFTIIFNGQIYNHLDLRKQFALQCRTNSDTETLLLLYEKLGEQMLPHLDGMFAFAIYDKDNQTLFIARDRAGKKPLYYYNDGEKMLFASELNALKSQLPLEMETDNMFHYLRFGSMYKSHTPYKKVKELGAGSFLTINCSALSVQETKWWNINDYFSIDNRDELNVALEKTDQMLREAIRSRIASSDLEVGCFLSGGIDSGLVVSIASEFVNKLKTMTISFEGEYNEAPLAKQVAARYSTDHTEVNISFQHLVNDVEGILCAYGEPLFDSSAIPSYYVSKAAKENVTVVLTGDGADEIFGGYKRYIPFKRLDFFAQHPLVSGGAGLLKQLLPVSHRKRTMYNQFYRTLSLAAQKNLQVYLSSGVDIFEDYQHFLLADEKDYLQEMQDDFQQINASPMSGLKKIMNLDFDLFLFNDVLVKMDIATMRNSLEGRSPFLCKSLLEYAPSLNDDFKVNGRNTKVLLRKLASTYLPEELVGQPKRGFEVPLKHWVDDQLKDMINDYLTSSNALNKTLVNQPFLYRLLNNPKGIPAEKRAKMLWTLFSMEVWYQKVYLSAAKSNQGSNMN